MRPPFPFCSSILLRREAPAAWESSTAGGRWCARRRVSSLRNGPVTQQDRWEEDAGYSPFTLAAEISALLAGADIADLTGHPEQAQTMRDTADAWNDNIERWIYATGGDLAQQLGIEGYYVRIAPPDTDGAASPTQGFVPIKNRPPGQDGERAYHIISPDALALVRFGLRAPDDPRILNTLRAIDALLAVELPQGPCWYRYNGDGYGEHKDGSAFDGTGIGRPWPLAGGRARALRSGRRTSRRGGGSAHCHGELHRGTRPPASGASLGCGRHSRRWNYFAESLPAPLARWSGLIPSTSSCGARFVTARSSTNRRKR